ncbi:MAG: DUF2442 domain-containing protein [Proteobacteria bacterium]|nr:DUF2442 domain-containing protein [Pseudomonadota bacterium]
MHLVNVKKAKYEKDYQIFLSFDDGMSGVVDFKKFLFEKSKDSVFTKLQDVNKFKKFSVKFHTLAWGEKLDLAPEYLHYLLVKQHGRKNLENGK